MSNSWSINPYMLYEIFNLYQMDQSISVLRGIWWYFTLCIQILQEYFVSNSGDPDRIPLSVAVSDLDLHCSSLTQKSLI